MRIRLGGALNATSAGAGCAKTTRFFAGAQPFFLSRSIDLCSTYSHLTHILFAQQNASISYERRDQNEKAKKQRETAETLAKVSA
jgi:hypothetical protein